MQCKFCNFASSSQKTLLKHFCLYHGQGAHWPCIHTDYVCVFKTPGALRSHLSRFTTVKSHDNLKFQCELCDFKEICSEKIFWNHLGHHLKKRETVQCPFLRCTFKKNTTKTHLYIYQSLKYLKLYLDVQIFFDKIVFDQKNVSGNIKSFQDGKYYKDNKLLGQQNICISLALYIDDFEVCNPLGTCRKLQKITAVYWVVLNLSARFRSSLTSIQLAHLGKSVDGYEKFLEPLLKDIKYLEQQGIFVEVVGQFIKSTVYCVCADNLGAHGLAGFHESFIVEKFCWFCLIRTKLQALKFTISN